MRHSARFLGLLGAGFCSLTVMSAIARADQTPVPTDTTPPPTYQDVAPIIANNCQFCHTGGTSASGGVQLDTEADVVKQAKLIFNAVDSGLMPYGDSEWHKTPDGVKLLAYLKSQIPAEPTPGAQ